MIDQTQAPPPTDPVLRPEARVVRADRSLAAMVLLVCTMGGMGIGFGSAMYLMRVQWGAGYVTAPPSMRALPAGAESDPLTWLGVGIRSFNGRDGSLVLRVFDGTAAQRAGFKPGDVVTSFDGQRLRGAEALVSAVRSRAPGELVEVGIERNGRPVTLHARLGKR